MKRDGKRGEMRDVGEAGECWGRVGMPSDTNCLLAFLGLGRAIVKGRPDALRFCKNNWGTDVGE